MRYLAALFLATVMAGQATADDFIVIVFDSSGSMDQRMSGGKTRMATAKEALVEVVSQVPDNTRIGVLTFEGWAYDLQKVDRAKFTAAINSIRPGGATPLYHSVRKGASRLLKERDNQLNKGTYRLVIVTDGVAGDDDLNKKSTFKDGSTRLGVMSDIARRRIGVDAIGLDMTGDHPIKHIVEEKKLGTYMAGNDPKSLKQHLKKAVAEVALTGQDTGEDAFKELDPLPDEFFVIATKGLTTNQNHPIGEMPPIVEVSADGTVTVTPDPNNEPAPDKVEGEGGGGIWVAGIVAGIIGAILLVVFLNKRS